MKSNLRPGLAARAQTDRSRFERLRAIVSDSNRFRPDAVKKSAAEIIGPIMALLVIVTWLIGLGAAFELPVTILTIAGFVLAILGLFAPALGLIGIGLLCTIDAVTRNFLLTGGLFRWNTFNYFLLIVIALNIVFLLRINDIHSRLLQLFIGLLAVELLISRSVMSGLLDILNIGAAFGLLVYFARGYQVKGGMYWMAVVSGLVSAMGGLIYYLQIDSLPYVNPNSWAFFPLTGLFAVCLGYPFAKDHRLGSLTLLILGAVNFLWIFLSGSRGTMLVGVLCLIFLFLWTRQFSWKVAFIGVAWLALGFFSLQFAEQQSYAVQRIQKLFNDQVTLESRTSGRTDIARAGVEIFLANPLGVGTGNFRESVAQTELISGELAAHSGWIKILAENGIPGILLLGAYVLSFMVVGIHRRNRDMFLLGLLVTTAFGAALVSKEFQGKGLWFFAVGATVILHADHLIALLNRKSRLFVEGRDRAQERATRLQRYQRDRLP